MSAISEIYKKLVAAGMSPDDIAETLALMEEAFGSRVAVPNALEKRREYDRLRKAEKRKSGGKSGGHDSAKSGGSPVESPVDTSRLTRVRDKPLKLVISGIQESQEANASFDLSSPNEKTSVTSIRPNASRLAFDAYNETAKTLNLPLATLLSADRQRKLDAILKIHGMDNWRQALTMLERSPHCLGQNDRGWRADFDFMLRPDKFTKLLEGSYAQGERHGQLARASVARIAREENLRRAFSATPASYREFD